MKLKNKTILVTGGTGSFGKAFCKKALELEAEKVIVLSRDELKQYEMSQTFTDPRMRFFLGDVRDKDRLLRAFHKVDIVVHAAALKQVPAAEYNPQEFIKTNIQGTSNVIDAAIDCKVSKVVVLSTDKAVNPINLYGATKLCAEKLTIAANNYSGNHKTQLFVVRYGNVAGSRGSVIPLYLKIMREGKHIYPITHMDMTRFWITMEQAISIVIQTIHDSGFAGIYVPKLSSMRITNLAKCIDSQAEFMDIGIRPGEKINETLVAEHEIGLEMDDYYLIDGAGAKLGPVTSDKVPVMSMDSMRIMIDKMMDIR